MKKETIDSKQVIAKIITMNCVSLFNPPTASFRLAWLTAVALLTLGFSSGLYGQPSGSGKLSLRDLTTQEVVSHETDGKVVRFALSSSPLSVSLQGMNDENGRWKSLLVVPNLRAKLNSILIPKGWENSDLRVVANHRLSNFKRETIRSTVNATEHVVTFSHRRNSRFYSIEARPDRKATWKRVSTIAANPSIAGYRVPLPSSIAASSVVRVVAVQGASLMPPELASSLPTAMRGGPSRFAEDIKVASSPVFSNNAMTQQTPGDANPGVTTNAPQESDIWKIRGQTIYFFNRLRGLQVIDTSNPANPQISELEIAAVGEEMYLLGDDASHADRALLISGLAWTPSVPETTRIHNISLVSGQLSEAGSIDLPGSYVESRMIGNFLHVVTTQWSSASGAWQPRTHLTTVDFSNGSLTSSAQQIVDLSASQVGATAKYLWLAAEISGYSGNHQLLAFPIAADGSLGNPKQTLVGGRIQDKFKVGDTADGLAVVVQNWQRWEQVTSLETYTDNGTEISASGSVELIRGESLYATRFDEDRCYVVTFRQTDPLWIVDLAVPATPTIRGHLEVPGWSTYIQPLGDVLIAVGRDGGKTQVSMFDVSNPDQPTLAKRIDVGTSWSWSEADWTEKAIKILPDSGLILIPVVEYANGSSTQRVSLVDFDVAAKTLTKRGDIEHDFSPRRAALLADDIIASVSNRQLLLVDASNRDAPVVVTDRVLAFGVDRVVTHQGVALMFENGDSSWASLNRSTVLRSSAINDIKTILSEIELPCSSVSAAAVYGDRLVVVEDSDSRIYQPFARSATPSNSTANISVWSLENPSQPVLIGRTPLPFASGSSAQILALSDGKIAIASRSSGWHYWLRPLPVWEPVANFTATMVSASRSIMPPMMGLGGQGLRIAVAQIATDTPSVLSSWNLEGDSYSGISDVFTNGDLLAFSFEQAEAMEVKNSENYYMGGWTPSSVRSWLQILDLADLTAPMPWAPVQIPGSLVSLSEWTRSGATVFTRSEDRIAALGFNGETAPVVAEVNAGFAHVMIGSALFTASEQGVARREFSSINGGWDPATFWPLNLPSAIHSLIDLDGRLAAISHNQAWILGADQSFVGYDILGSANFRAAARSGDTWIAPAGEYGPLLLEP
jgi:hypothetical protein